MSKVTKTQDSGEIQTQLRLRLKYHPLRMFTYLVLISISSSFLFLSVGYFATTFGTDFNRFKLPLLFHANTIIILVSSYTISQMRKALNADDWRGYMMGLFVTAGLGIAFIFFQLTAWGEMHASGIALKNSIAGAYLYVISGLHIIHLAVGVLALLWFSVKAIDQRNDAVKLLLFDSDPFAKMKVELLCTYWHFVDALWIYIYLFFVVNIYVMTNIRIH